MKKFTLAILVSTIAFAGEASAADMPTAASSYWNSGFYAGLNVGGIVSGKSTMDLYSWEDGDEGKFSESDSGFLGGAQLGVNFLTNGLLLGLEADYQLLDYNAQMPNTPYDDAQIGQDISGLGTARVRAGAFIGDQTLIYVTGGFAFTNEDVRLHDETGHTADTDSTTGTGWTIGGGLEHAFDEHWSLKGEYLYVETKSDAHTYFSDEGEDYYSNNTFKSHIARIGVNYRF